MTSNRRVWRDQEFGGERCTVTRIESPRGDVLLLFEYTDGSVSWCDFDVRQIERNRKSMDRRRQRRRPLSTNTQDSNDLR